MGPRPNSFKYGVQILTSDPATGIIEAVAKGANHLRISVVTTPVAFRWPVPGEGWVVRMENGNWYLDAPYPQTSAPVGIHDVAPGDIVLNSPTGRVHVLGSENGATDAFNVTPVDRGRATLSGGTAVVEASRVTATSSIFLTAQDNNTIGTLRVSARAAGTGFTITSSDGFDHGVVSYLVFD